jgi:hypothetical protein
MLYFIMVGYFLRFGHSEFWLRFVSAFFGALAAPVIYIAGKEIFNDRRIGLLSALFIAMSNVHLGFSQEARYYTVMFFLSALSLFLFANFLKRQNIISLLLITARLFHKLSYPSHNPCVFGGAPCVGAFFPCDLCAGQGDADYALEACHIALFLPAEGGEEKERKGLKKRARQRGHDRREGFENCPDVRSDTLSPHHCLVEPQAHTSSNPQL